jgi:hypothetical protein
MITLDKISTRELLKELRSRRAWYQDDTSGTKPEFVKRIFVASRLVTGGEHDAAMATLDELQEELNRRPHVPGKPEGKLLRRLMKETGWTADQLRAHPRFGAELADAQHPNRREIYPWLAKHLAPALGKDFGSRYKVVTRK